MEAERSVLEESARDAGSLRTQPRAHGLTYHQEVVEQEDFALVQPELLGLVRVRNLEEPAVADEAAVWQRQHLRRGAASARAPAGDASVPAALLQGDRLPPLSAPARMGPWSREAPRSAPLMQPETPSSQALHPEGSQPQRPSLGGCVGT